MHSLTVKTLHLSTKGATLTAHVSGQPTDQATPGEGRRENSAPTLELSARLKQCPEADVPESSYSQRFSCHPRGMGALPRISQQSLELKHEVKIA